MVAHDAEEPAFLQQLNQFRVAIATVDKVSQRKQAVLVRFEVLPSQVLFKPVKLTMKVTDDKVPTALVAAKMAMLCKIMHASACTASVLHRMFLT
jgi:hypothetical protein